MKFVEPKAGSSLLTQFFLNTVENFPEEIAVEFPPSADRSRQRFTYLEFAQQIAALLPQIAPHIEEPQQRVAILLPQSCDLYLAQLATLFAGASYVCIDESIPDARVRQLFSDCTPALTITDGRGRERLSKLNIQGPRVVLGQEQAMTETEPLASPSWLKADHLAYLIYTSGTTGQPKGVMIEHRSIANLVADDLAQFELGPGDRVAQGSSAAYDSSVEEIWLALASGATLVVMDKATTRLGPDLISWLQEERITVLCPPPTLLRATGCLQPQVDLPLLRLLYVGGEALPSDLADRWAAGRRMVNGYGPTECTVTALRAEIRPGLPVSIGKEVAELQAWVLDEQLQEVATGGVGELCIGGVGLARGYLGDAALTKRRFPIHPKLGRIYRTGDLARRDEDGLFHCLGRIDSQVKLRGHRIELEEVEAQLVTCGGVRAAGCALESTETSARLVASIVRCVEQEARSSTEILQELRSKLPEVFVPSAISFVQDLPTTVGGKLDRAAVLSQFAPENAPNIATTQAESRVSIDGADPWQADILDAFQEHLPGSAALTLEANFFTELGGDSLRAALVISSLRAKPRTAGLAVRDLYQSPTIEELAQVARDAAPIVKPPCSEVTSRTEQRPILATAGQCLWWLLGLTMASTSLGLGIQVFLWLVTSLGPIMTLLLLPALGTLLFAIYLPMSVLGLGAAKRLLIGRYQQERVLVWGPRYLRHWVLENAARWVPWSWLQGTVFQHSALRWLGARIGKRVHLDRGVDLTHGGWDLLELGDEVCIGRDASLRLVERDAGHLAIGAIAVAAGATIETRATLSAGSRMEAESTLTAHSSLGAGACIPAGESWDGVPARRQGQSMQPAALSSSERAFSAHVHGILLIATRGAVSFLLGLPMLLASIVACWYWDISSENVTRWVRMEPGSAKVFVPLAAMLVAGAILSILSQAILCRLLGRVAEAHISRWSFGFIRAWIKMGIVESAGRWLSGTLFWPSWLRLAGARIKPGCEISTVMNVIPELTHIGRESFFADGIYVGGPQVSRGVASFSEVTVGSGCFLGNHVVLPTGTHLDDDLLLGVSTVADSSKMKKGTSWFGLPAFCLPRREVLTMDRTLTHDPGIWRWLRRCAWELARFVLPVIGLAILQLWLILLATTDSWQRPIPQAILGVAIATLLTAVTVLLAVLTTKWLLIGRVRSGQHGLWSGWCSRWDFVYVIWGALARPLLTTFEGSLLLAWYLRAMGMKIGRRVVLGPGFAQVVDPDMISLGDDSTVSAIFQAHSFEDRVLKINKINIEAHATVGEGAVVLYGAEIKNQTQVAANSVVMKHEQLISNQNYEGSPAALSVDLSRRLATNKVGIAG